MIRIAILDLYAGQPNQGMRCLYEIAGNWSLGSGIPISIQEFDVRQKQQVPDLSFDIYLSSGGPGSPYDGEGSEWETLYFQWLEEIVNWNRNPANTHKKFAFFICHSFELICRYYQLGQVTRRNSTSFGIFPVHFTPAGRSDRLFENLNDPFYVVDSRDWQIIQPDASRLELMGASILCIEKERPHVPYERAVMGIRFNEYMWGTQFHPEADAEGMSLYLQLEDKKQMVVKHHGEEKWISMVEQLNDPNKIMWTYANVLPNFFDYFVNLHPQHFSRHSSS